MLSIDPDKAQTGASQEHDVDIVELHTGVYADSEGDEQAITVKAHRNCRELCAAIRLAGHGCTKKMLKILCSYTQS